MRLKIKFLEEWLVKIKEKFIPTNLRKNSLIIRQDEKEDRIKNELLINKTMKIEAKPREEMYGIAYFEWVKTERAGDISRFKEFSTVGEVEYIVFEDNTRIDSQLIGDVVLMHEDQSQIMGRDIMYPEKTDAEILGYTSDRNIPRVETKIVSNDNPVLAILDKSKKKTEKITLSLTVKIPSVDLYNVIRENFDDVDNVILETVMDQLQERLLKDALKRELQNIYSKKKKV